jgi:hypothetical protein
MRLPAIRVSEWSKSRGGYSNWVSWCLRLDFISSPAGLAIISSREPRLGSVNEWRAYEGKIQL